MTRPEYSNTRELTISLWIRENLPDSSLGYMVTDLDFIIYNFMTKRIMLLEIKTRNADLKIWQNNLFKNLALWISKGIDPSWEFLGFHVIKFENTSFYDGKVYWDNLISNEENIKNILSCI